MIRKVIKKFLNKILNFIKFYRIKVINIDKLGIFSKEKISSYKKNINNVYDKSKYLLIEKNKYLIKPKYNNIKGSEIAVDNTLDSWEKYWDDSSNINEYLSESRIDFFIELIKEINSSLIPGKIIDIGCGTGSLLKFLINDIKSKNNITDFDFYASDFSKYSIEKCKAELSDYKIIYSIDNIYHLPYESNFFNNIICTEVLEHLEKPETAYEEMLRICKKDGLIFITVPNGDLDTYIGHLNFWNIDSFNEFINKKNIEISTSLISEDTVIFCIIKKLK